MAYNRSYLFRSDLGCVLKRKRITLPSLRQSHFVPGLKETLALVIMHSFFSSLLKRGLVLSLSLSPLSNFEHVCAQLKCG